MFFSVTVIVTVLVIIGCDGSFPGGLPSSGVPCYLHPSQDECHYRLRPGSDACTTASDRKRLNEGILLVNRTLTSLEQQLIRLGVIPPDSACSELPDVEHGGIIYDDLNLASGATGRYICDEGYILVSLQNRHVFTCTDEGIWDGNVTEVPVKCLVSTDRCDIPEEIINGTISYIDNNTANIMVGDVITYSCALGTELEGPVERFCLRTGNWSGYSPLCVYIGGKSNDDHGRTSTDKDVVIGASVGSVMGVIVLVILLIIVATAIVCFLSNRKKGTTHQLNLQEDNNDSVTTITPFSSHTVVKSRINSTLQNSYSSRNPFSNDDDQTLL